MVCGHSLTEDEGYQHVLTCHPPSGFHGSQLVRIDEESETKSSASKEPLSDQLQCICQVCGHCIDVSECDTHMTTCIAPKRFNQQRFIMLSSKSETEKKRPSSPPPVPVVLPTTPSSPKRPSSPPPPAPSSPRRRPSSPPPATPSSPHRRPSSPPPPVPVLSPSSPHRTSKAPSKTEESIDTTVVVAPSSQPQSLPENPFAVDTVELAPLVVDLTVNPFDDTDVTPAEVPETIESPSATPSGPVTSTVNPFGEEKEFVLKEEEVPAKKIVTKDDCESI